MTPSYFETYIKRHKKLNPYLKQLTKNLTRETFQDIFDEISSLGPSVFSRAFDLAVMQYFDLEKSSQINWDNPKVYAFIQMVREAGGCLHSTKEGLEGETITLFHRLWHTAKHEANGKHVYELTGGLADRLLNTELRGLTCDHLQLPFDAAYYQIPPSLGLEIPNVLTGNHTVDGAFITLDEYKGQRCWLILVTALPKNPEDEYDDALFSYSVPLTPGKPIQEVIQELSRKNVPAEVQKVMVKMFTFLMNIIIYATSAEARVDEFDYNKTIEKLQQKLSLLPKSAKHKKKRVQLKEQLKKETPCRRILLGKGLSRLNLSGGGHKLTKKVMVSGHWKNQPCGPKRQFRKTIFIEPYWKGEDFNEDTRPERRVLR